MQNAKKLSLHDFMAAANNHYYAEHVVFGEKGDFYTSPEITPVFGELIGLSFVDIWQKMGSPADFSLVELGPGNGTLMADILRVGHKYWGSPRINLVETSHRLRAEQAQTLAAYTENISWHDRFSEIPIDRPFLLVANEFFDALPVSHVRFQNNQWQEKHVIKTDQGWSEEWMSCETPPFTTSNATETQIEYCPLASPIFTDILNGLKTQRGYALVIDYGYVSGQISSSIQACRNQKRTHIYDKPGQTDISAYVNFGELSTLAKHYQCAIYGPVTQAQYLTNLGLATRIEQYLSTTANPHKHLRAARILIDPLAMGQIFKVMGIASSDMGKLPGFPLTPETASDKIGN